MKRFNTTGTCFPQMHYMVDISERVEHQLAEYLDYFHLDTGYLVSFCFHRNKQPGIYEVEIGEKKIIEAVV